MNTPIDFNTSYYYDCRLSQPSRADPSPYPGKVRRHTAVTSCSVGWRMCLWPHHVTPSSILLHTHPRYSLMMNTRTWHNSFDDKQSSLCRPQSHAVVVNILNMQACGLYLRPSLDPKAAVQHGRLTDHYKLEPRRSRPKRFHIIQPAAKRDV